VLQDYFSMLHDCYVITKIFFKELGFIYGFYLSIITLCGLVGHKRVIYRMKLLKNKFERKENWKIVSFLQTSIVKLEASEYYKYSNE